MPIEKSPLVTAVIPTRNRPEFVQHAVASALGQTFNNLEVVVVIDGPDPATEAALRAVSDSRLRVLVLPEHVGGSGARNAGVCAAHGEWIAFLDDDDEWLPQKVNQQVAVARNSAFEYPIVSSQVIARTPDGDHIWPRRRPEQPLSEYLFARNSWSYGEGVLQTTTLFAPKELFLRCGFTAGLKRYQDWDWLLRSIQQPGAGLEFIAEPLAIWQIERSRPSVSRTFDWEFSVGWIRRNKDRVTPRAYAGFIAATVASEASAQRAWRAFLGLLWEMSRNGAPKLFDYALYLGMWLPAGLRRRLARLLSR
ncbi:MAG: glycosyltransferase family 2 protein [Bryobacteraceae bacterium]|jgi:glycosyltransferase involved in cell wall biosynthesis